jgi:hypothetical protein
MGSLEPAKGTDRCSISLSRSVAESALKSLDTSTQALSSCDLLSGSDEDVAVKETLNRHFHKYYKENSGKSREHLLLDKRLIDERNSSQVSQEKEVKIDSENKAVNETGVIKRNTGKSSIQSESFEDYSDCFQGKHIASPAYKNGDHVKKKPIPLPRQRTQKRHFEPSKPHEADVEGPNQKTVPLSSSLSPILPIDKFGNTSIQADDGDNNDCVQPEKVERKVKSKKIEPCNVEKREEIELRNIETVSDLEVDGKEVSSGRKSFHKSRRDGKEIAIETDLMTEESQAVKLSYNKIVGIFIHRSECLQVDPLVRHPVVKVHLIDAATGNYLKKSNCGRSVSFYYENCEVDYILPLMTEVFDYKERR